MTAPKLGSVAIAAMALALCLAGCTSGRSPFLVAEVCLGDASQASAFESEMEAIATERGMTYENSDGRVAASPIYFSVTGPGNFGLFASNLDMPRNQVSIGFQDDGRPAEGKLFATSVLERLDKKWRVDIAPPGRGATPMSDCSDASHVPTAAPHEDVAPH